MMYQHYSCTCSWRCNGLGLCSRRISCFHTFWCFPRPMNPFTLHSPFLFQHSSIIIKLFCGTSRSSIEEAVYRISKQDWEYYYCCYVKYCIYCMYRSGECHSHLPTQNHHPTSAQYQSYPCLPKSSSHLSTTISTPISNSTLSPTPLPVRIQTIPLHTGHAPKDCWWLENCSEQGWIRWSNPFWPQ